MGGIELGDERKDRLSTGAGLNGAIVCERDEVRSGSKTTGSVPGFQKRTRERNRIHFQRSKIILRERFL